jgi:hypothetical protein
MATVINGENVVSHILPQEGLYWVLALSTRISDRTLLVGIGIGDGPTMTPVANQVLRVLAENSNKENKVFIVLCRNKDTAAARVRAAVRAAKNGEVVFILCKDSAVIDAVHITRLLGFEL